MKHFIYISFFVCILFPTLLGCSFNEGKSLNEITVENRSSKNIYSLNGSAYTGRIYKYAKESEILILEFNVLSGVYNGVYREYHPNGSLRRSANYSNGVFNGIEEKYYENGQLSESVNYVQGNFNGKRMVYWTNGILKEENFFNNGVLGGDNFYYYSDGKLRKSLKFDFNKKRNGVWEDFHPNGQLKLRVKYKNGIILSKSEEYDFNGNIISN